MALISIKKFADDAEAKGFRVRRFGMDRLSYVEIFTPEHKGPDGVWNWDSLYSTADIIISDRPSCGYGYNDWFNGPWHNEMTQDTAYGVQKLLSHPAMQ